jgi:hypothetical protein
MTSAVPGIDASRWNRRVVNLLTVSTSANWGPLRVYCVLSEATERVLGRDCTLVQQQPLDDQFTEYRVLAISPEATCHLRNLHRCSNLQYLHPCNDLHGVSHAARAGS